jgi:hypothetical protein
MLKLTLAPFCLAAAIWALAGCASQAVHDREEHPSPPGRKPLENKLTSVLH